MAEFKLGRIRFVWQGEWTSGHTYYKDDVVKFGGKVYICQAGHVGAASFYTNLGNWDLMSDGQVWTGDWTTGQTYKLNDLVKYGGLVYICTVTHDSAATEALGLETDFSNWDLVADGFDWKGEWAPDTRYKLHDLVKYGGYTYVCTAHHTSQSTPTLGLEPNIGSWEPFNQGLEFKGTWAQGQRYKLNDVVKYGANLWICTEYNTSASTFEADVAANKWDAFVEGLQYENDWNSSTIYQPGDVVHYGGNQYVATSNHSNSTPTAGTDWDLFSRGFSFQSDWAIGTAYKVGQVVRLNGYTYLCIEDHTGHEPPNGTYWEKLNSGTKWLGEWANSTAYKAGDLVRYGANVYICILAHTSADDDSTTLTDTAKSPITDLTATYWNVFNVGSETAVMQVTGDIVYYAENGPVRLPVGSEGQILKVDGASTPVWDYLGVVDHVYYVAPTGTDLPAPTWGRTLDKPWKTIRYACEQVEKGCRNPVTTRLLELNRVFIQREVTKWIEYQIHYYTTTVPTPSSKWYNFTYDEFKCERDVGFLVDRLIWDVGHGGNVKMRAAAQTYVNALSEGPYSNSDDSNGTGTYTKIATEGDNDVEAFNYMLTVIQAVINQEAPASNYQALAGDSSTAVVLQGYDSNIGTAEAGVMATITDLVGIVTTALTDGTSANIPERYAPANVINVKSGVYYETLPIIVPAETCILGDEVRAVTVSPADSLIPANDVQYSIATYDRLASVVNSVVAGGTVTTTTGNTLTQDINWPYAGSAEQTTVSRLVRAMKHKVDFDLGAMQSAVLTDPTDYNITFPAAGYGNARELIKANKKFVQEQVVAWMEANYPTLKYGKTKTRQDVGYIVDAMVYDLTYGGNALSVQAGLAYYDGDDNTQPMIPASIKTAVLGAQTYLKSMLGAIATNTTVTPNQTTVTQTTGTAGSAGAATFVQSNMDTIYTIINGGPAASYTLTDPSTAWVASNLTTAYSTLNSASSTIQTNVIDYINTNYGSFTYNSALCRRDAGYLVDAGYYDAAFGSNFWAVQNGISYYRTQSARVLSSQLAEEIGTVNYIKTQAATALASNATAVSRSNAAYAEIVDILTNGVASADALVYTDTGTANFTNARAQLVTNRAFIISTMVTWMTANVPGYVALSADKKLLCQRDLGYAIDALAYDVNYGGNLATRNFCRSLFNNITGASIESVNSGTTYTQLGVVCAAVVRELQAGQDTSGTAASATEATRMTTLCGNIASVATAGNLDSLVAESAPSISWVSAGIQTAVGTLASSKTTIVNGALQFITDNYSDFVYSHSKSMRDASMVIKAVGYDFMFNTNYRTIKAAYAYLRSSASELFDKNSIIKNVTRAAQEYVRTQAIANVGSDATAIARINTLMQLLDDIIFGGSTEGSVCQTEVRAADYAALQLERNKDFIIEEIRAWLNYNYVNFNNYYNSSTCARDIGYIIDAVISDVATGSNFASSVAGESYYRIQAALVPGAQMMQTVAAVKEAKRLTEAYTDSTLVASVRAAYDNVINILSTGLTAVPTYTWPDNGTSTTGAGGTVTDAALLQTNRATLITGIQSYLNTTYSTLWNTTLSAEQRTACLRDVGYIIDAVTYDLQYGGTMQTTIAGSAYYSFGTLKIAGGEKAATLAALTQLSTDMQALTSSTNDATVNAKITVIYNIINSGATEPMTYTIPSVAGESATKQSTHAAILAAKSTIESGVTTYITNTYSSYTYNEALCLRDVSVTIDALKWDLKNLSNYKTSLAARYYVNAVIGNAEEDMYYLRNGTGVRNQTLTGLTGDLTPPNDYGTSRVTAGSYVSLDPGWGPDDFRTWINHRSPYIQNCATFGYGAVGQKIDGALHNGGYKSFVSNDFTQLISDGIGAWVTNNARAELVSVFTYYSHIGYLSEAGGRIRGTNGNNSYGDFGAVAEGYDATETSLGAVIDNRYQFKATVGKVPTSNSQMYHFEYDHAGTDYTEATWLVVGPGNFGDVEQDEFRDDGVSNIRLLDNVDDSTNAPESDGNIGGYGYVFKTNTAQTGSTTSITLAATDDSASTAYIGMKIIITAGSGVGQYALISTYSNGTKIAGVVTESTGAAGWDHFIPGTAITAPDSSSTYQIEPAVSFTAPTFATTATTVPSGTWTTAIYGNTAATYLNLSGTYSGSGTGAKFTVVRNGSRYYVTKTSSGTGYTRLETITIPGTDVGGLSTTNDITITITSVNSATGGIQAIDFEGHGLGGRFVALQSGSRNGATSEDGITWTSRSNLMPTASTWSDMAFGKFTDGSTTEHVSVFVAVAAGSANTAGAYSLDGLTWNAADMVTSAVWAGVAFGNSRFVAIASDSTTVRISYDGIVWDTTGTLPSTGFTSIAYGMGLFVAVKSGSTTAVYSTNGVTWSTSVGGMPTGSNWSSVTWGNGRFVAVATGAVNAGAYSLNGTSWTAMTLPTTTSWTNVEYGQGVFLAVSSGTAAATSEDGVNWTSRTLTTAASGYSHVAFGNPQRSGIFASVGGGTGTVANYTTFGARTKARAYVESNKIVAIRVIEPGSGYASAPTITITDPNNTYEAPTTVNLHKGVLGNPSFKNRGTGYTTSSAELQSGDGYAETYQNGSYIAVRRITSRPTAGSNVVIGGLSGTYKLVNIVSFVGEYDGSYTAFYQISPVIRASQNVEHGASVTTRIRYSQVRLTGHDFLNIGYGNFVDSNYPNNPINGNTLTQSTETVENNGGRVFYTSTDQDGNFRVGDLFTVEQSTGVATLNADAFNVSGLQELSLGNLSLSGNSASITEFSTDPFFTANSDNIVPTQRAIKAYIASQIGGGGASLIVNSITAGSIFISGNVITTVTNEAIQMNANFEFRGGITGLPLAFNYFLT